MSKYIRL